MERTLEKERDDNKKEKANRKRNEKLQLNILQRVQQVHTYVVFNTDSHEHLNILRINIFYSLTIIFLCLFLRPFSDNRIDLK